jgi:hypothetical protein
MLVYTLGHKYYLPILRINTRTGSFTCRKISSSFVHRHKYTRRLPTNRSTGGGGGKRQRIRCHAPPLTLPSSLPLLLWRSSARRCFSSTVMTFGELVSACPVRPVLDPCGAMQICKNAFSLATQILQFRLRALFAVIQIQTFHYSNEQLITRTHIKC